MIPKLWPDMTALLLTHLRPLHDGVTITRTQQDAPVRQVVLDTEYQQMETVISRRCAVILEARVKAANGTADVAASFNLMNAVLLSLQRTPTDLPRIVGFDSLIGPRVAKDAQKFEYHEGSIVLVVS